MLGISAAAPPTPVLTQTIVQRATPILLRTQNTSDLKLSSAQNGAATSTGPVTLSDGGYVEVQPNKTWIIT
jgi:hypothetical protein